MFDRRWFGPLLVAAVVFGLFGLILVSAGMISFMEAALVVVAIGLVVVAFIARRKPAAPDAPSWVPWAVTAVATVAAILLLREINIRLLDAGVEPSYLIEGEAKEAVAATLRDPTSAMFTDVRSDGVTVCGNVNGRNGFGAYAGASRFVWSRAGGPQIEGALGTSGFENVDRMQQCFFDQEWSRCQGVSAPVEDCAQFAVP